MHTMTVVENNFGELGRNNYKNTFINEYNFPCNSNSIFIVLYIMIPPPVLVFI